MFLTLQAVCEQKCCHCDICRIQNIKWIFGTLWLLYLQFGMTLLIFISSLSGSGPYDDQWHGLLLHVSFPFRRCNRIYQTLRFLSKPSTQEVGTFHLHNSQGKHRPPPHIENMPLVYCIAVGQVDIHQDRKTHKAVSKVNKCVRNPGA